MAVLQIDTTVTPPATRIFVIGGGVNGAAVARNPQTVEVIDLTSPGPGTAWNTPALTMQHSRFNVNAVLLPDGTVFIVGGLRAGTKFIAPDPVLEGEVFDPATGTFTLTPPMQFPRQYHSVAVLLPDGRVLCAGGIDPTHPVQSNQRQLEVYSPHYLDMGPRPQITALPATASQIDRVVLIRPNTVTHHTDAEHRWIRVPIVATTGSSIDVQMPATASIAPPGPYMLFLVDTSGVPSEAEFIRIG
jgi:hypothetical protein